MSLSVENYSIAIGGCEILKNISCSFKSFGITLIIGENGCGKTTFLKSFFNQTKVISGDLKLFGKHLSPADYSNNVEKFSIYLHEENFWDGPVKEYLSIGELKEVNSDNYNEISHLYNQNYNCLSQGQKQSVNLSKVLAKRSQVIFLDEPFSFLDIKQKEIFFQKIKEVSRHKTVIIVSHDWEYLKNKVDQILIIKSKKMLPFHRDQINIANPLIQ
ncbi:MAG: ABC transporter ATP-binding protein [Halobacteriovoraceae bacterium]|nr:ABC transporter ATP-binding protein [Halobacteriovoraceae bacterium]